MYTFKQVPDAEDPTSGTGYVYADGALYKTFTYHAESEYRMIVEIYERQMQLINEGTDEPI